MPEGLAFKAGTMLDEHGRAIGCTRPHRAGPFREGPIRCHPVFGLTRAVTFRGDATTEGPPRSSSRHKEKP